MSNSSIIVVGGGLAGLMATIKAAEAGTNVKLFSIVPVKRSHSVCAQGGINGAVNTKGEGDSPWEHFDDTVYGGDFLANQPPVKAMCEAAPSIIHLLDRMGVMFNRTPEGLLDFRRFGERSITERHMPEQRRASSFCMRSMSRFAVLRSKDLFQNTKAGNSSAPYLMTRERAGGSSRKT